MRSRYIDREHNPNNPNHSVRTIRIHELQEQSADLPKAGLHLHAASLGNDKGVIGEQFRKWGNQDRFFYRLYDQKFIAGVADEGQGTDKVDKLVELMLDQECIAMIGQQADYLDLQNKMQSILQRYAYHCNVGFAAVFGHRPSDVLAPKINCTVLSAGNVGVFSAKQDDRYTWAQVNHPIDAAGKQRGNITQGQIFFETSTVQLSPGDVLLCMTDGLQIEQPDNSKRYAPPKYTGGSYGKYIHGVLDASQQINYGNGDRGFDDRTALLMGMRPEVT